MLESSKNAALKDWNRVAGAIYEVSRTESGKVFMDWLNDLAFEKVIGPDQSNNELRMQEGIRQLVLTVRNMAIAYNEVQEQGNG